MSADLAGIPSEEFVVGHATPPKEIERTANGSIQATTTGFFDQRQVPKTPDSTSVSHRASVPLTEKAYQIDVNPFAFAFDIGRVDQEFTAKMGEPLQRFE